MRILRLTDPEITHQILGNLTRELERISGGMSSQVRILSGLEEGVDGWMTINYLKNSSAEEPTVGALDWGGASSQITWVVENESASSNYNISFDERNFRLFSKSNLCYGQSEALKRHRALLIFKRLRMSTTLNQTEAFVVEDPCLPVGSSIDPVPASELFVSPCTKLRDQQFMNHMKEANISIGFISSQNMSQCSSAISDQFNPAVCTALFAVPDAEETCIDPTSIPSPPGRMRFIAFSTYWYLKTGMDLGSSFSFEDFNSRVTEICSRNRSSSSNVNKTCFQGLFMIHLLEQAYHFKPSNWHQIEFLKRVSGAEVGWSLGHALIEANSNESPIKEHTKRYLEMIKS